MRIVGPQNAAGGPFWMTLQEFQKLQTEKIPRVAWRRDFAVWANWNPDGQYVVYTVPKDGLKVWRGPLASQKQNDAVLKGGSEQIVFYPEKDMFLEKSGIWFRQEIKDKNISGPFETGWGYTDFSAQLSDKVVIPLLEAQLIKAASKDIHQS